jgi:hypothetical protein
LTVRNKIHTFAAGSAMKIFKKITVFVLAVFLLASSVGIAINKVMCLSGGKTKMSFFEKPTCCPADANSASSDFSIDARCCDYLSEYVQVDYVSFENTVKIKVLQAALISAVLSLNSFLIDRAVISCTADTPPLLYGISLLKFISVFRI